MNTRKLCRILTALSLAVVLVVGFSVTAYATPEDAEETIVNQHLDEMADAIYDVYLFARNQIAIPLIIVSIASCGFRVLSGVFFEGGPNPMGAAIKQFVTSIFVLILLFAIPGVIGYIRNLLEATAWKPSGSAFLLPSYLLRGKRIW